MAGEQVTKMKVEAFKDIKFSGASLGEFELQVNPSEVQFSFGIGYGDAQSSASKDVLSTGKESAIGGNASPQVFTGYKVPDLSIDTIIDATGVLTAPKGVKLEVGGKPSVQPYIELIKKVMYSWQSEEHGPAFLKVQWGKVFPTNSSNSATPDGIFRCQLEDLSIKYTLFSATGNPVRAELTFKFIGVEDPLKAAEGYSPDLSHIIDIKFGDNLPKLCKEIYGSPEYFLQIARINNLPSIYAIEPGMKLIFPPLEKASR
jgi:nucleoid-associated protein YgaU